MLGTDSKDKSTGPATDSILARRPYTVGRSDIVKTILLSGEMVAERSRDLSCPRIRSGFSSTVTFMADEGSTVREGDRILEFDSSDLVSSKAEAERKLDEAELLIRKTTADLEAQRCDLANEVVQAEGRLKIAQLYAAIPRELLPSNDYQSYQVELERTQLTLDKALEKLKNHDDSVPAQMGLVEVEKTQAELDLRKIESDLKLLQVNAPQNGIVVYGDNWRENRKVQVGDAVYPGMRIISLPDLSSMQAIGYIYDTELRYLNPGMSCDISLDALPGRLWKGSIVSITSVAGRKGFASDHKVFKATIRLENQDTGVMRPGMTTRIQVPVKMASNAISIPRNYLDQDTHGGFRVWKDGGPKGPSPQNVEVGAHGENLVEIISGLNVGEVLYPAGADAEDSR
jgi:multidrug resistance efflux pump